MGGVYRWFAIVGCLAIWSFHALGLKVKTTSVQEPDLQQQGNEELDDSEQQFPQQYGAMQPYGMQPYGMQPYNMQPYAYNPSNWMYSMLIQAIERTVYKTIVKDVKQAFLNLIFKHPSSRTQKLSDDKDEDEDSDENTNANSDEDNSEDERDDVGTNSNEEDSDDDVDSGGWLSAPDKSEATQNRKQGFAITRKTPVTLTLNRKFDKRQHLKTASNSAKKTMTEVQNGGVPGLPAPVPVEYAQPMPEMAPPFDQPMPEMAPPLDQPMPEMAQPLVQPMPETDLPPAQSMWPMGMPIAQPMPPAGQPLSPYGPFFPPEFIPPPQATLPSDLQQPTLN